MRRGVGVRRRLGRERVVEHAVTDQSRHEPRDGDGEGRSATLRARSGRRCAVGRRLRVGRGRAGGSASAEGDSADQRRQRRLGRRLRRPVPVGGLERRRNGGEDRSAHEPHRYPTAHRRVADRPRGRGRIIVGGIERSRRPPLLPNRPRDPTCDPDRCSVRTTGLLRVGAGRRLGDVRRRHDRPQDRPGDECDRGAGGGGSAAGRRYRRRRWARLGAAPRPAKVARIDPATNAVVDTIAVSGTPMLLNVAFGDVWVPDYRGSTIWRLTP